MGSATIGSVLTFLASNFTAKHKIEELELLHLQKLEELEQEYRQKLDEAYYENARNHNLDLYFPLHSNLTFLENQYDKFRNFVLDITFQYPHSKPDKNALRLMTEEAESEYRKACKEFTDQITKLLNQNVFLTSQFESNIRVFNQFIQRSLLLNWEISNLYKTIGVEVESRNIFNKRNLSNFLKRDTKRTTQVFSDKKTLDFNISFEEMVVPAVIITELYAHQFKYGVNELKSYIKEITASARLPYHYNKET